MTILVLALQRFDRVAGDITTLDGQTLFNEFE